MSSAYNFKTRQRRQHLAEQRQISIKTKEPPDSIADHLVNNRPYLIQIVYDVIITVGIYYNTHRLGIFIVINRTSRATEHGLLDGLERSRLFSGRGHVPGNTITRTRFQSFHYIYSMIRIY